MVTIHPIRGAGRFAFHTPQKFRLFFRGARSPPDLSNDCSAAVVASMFNAVARTIPQLSRLQVRLQF